MNDEHLGGDPDDSEGDLVAVDRDKRCISRKRTILIATGAVTALALAVVVVLVVSGRQEPDYGDVSRSRFIEACTADGGEPVRGACECMYDGIVANIAYERFAEVDRELSVGASSDTPVELPDDIESIRRDCVARS